MSTVLNPSITRATTLRVLRQLRADPRTIAMIVVVPTALLTLMYFLYRDSPGGTALFSRIALVLLGVLPFALMFIVTSIAMQRERVSGTLERLLTTPLAKADLLLGYAVAFSVAATAQAVVATTVAAYLLGMETAGSVWLVVLIAVVDAWLGVALGLLFSAFARTEFQAVQFMPIVVVPQIFLCGLLVPHDAMPGWLQGIADVLPMTYAVRALQEVGAHGAPTSTMWTSLAVVAGFAVAALALAAATLPRKVA
ncbi:ABC transporter permease [Tsukamurella paurometabola]|uniref:Transport permease protein n=1 Tax=Tsukamurella paurometabola TaxID=2061 RepID=A0A3P8MCG3_TSUPA|nr:ABC transporter permease [Tsukamurella paurometabola]MBS4100888.1 ABC transporter permease [Tsukamurella paurometabola]UEA83407.1 ABC transporter permease [Tsukamurella paurometabola]VDR40520.1 Inner membrane transport permease ybhR [Tsukamurella paurometabola]